MQNANEIKQHISAVEQTRKITNAMNLIASSRLTQVMRHIEYNQKYFMRVQAVMKDILSSQGESGITHPYLEERSGSKKTYIVVSGDKGLAGPYNSAVLSFAKNYVVGSGCHLINVGITASEYFKSFGITPDDEILGVIQNPTLSSARQLAYDIFDLYNAGETDEVYIIYTSFYGKTKNTPVIRRLLPIMESDYDDIPPLHEDMDIVYEPSPQAVFDILVPQYTTGILFGAMIQACAAEHFARMNAMESATNNADDMISKLRLQYNMARQSAITREITEIAGASMSDIGQAQY